jgi:formate dehydrogenase subunit gamma
VSKSKEEIVTKIVNLYKEIPGPLLIILHAVQAELDYIPSDAVPLIAEGLNLSRAEIHGG